MTITEGATVVSPYLTMNSLGQLLGLAARRTPERVALITEDRTMTYGELDRESTCAAAGLLSHGVKPGDRVALLSENLWEWVVAYHAILKAGAVVNPLNVMLTADEVCYILKDAGATALIASGEKLAAVERGIEDLSSLSLRVSFEPAPGSSVSFDRLLAEEPGGEWLDEPPSPDATACIAYTSGTTGRPKGAMQSHRSLVLNCAYTATMHARTSDDIAVTALPAPHVYGNVAVNSTFMVGGTVVLLRRFNPEIVLESISRYRASLFEGVPAMYAMLLASPALPEADLSSLTRCTVGGQTISASTVTAWEDRTGAPLIELWGMTELSGLGTTHAVWAPNVHGSVGVTLPGVEAKVVTLDDPRVECGVNEPGELVVRGPIVMQGYFHNPEATREAIDENGWLHTGDIATHDGHGHLFVVDRLKDMILTGGYNVYPAEIERVLIGHESVALVGVGRQHDDVKGEVAHAFVVPAEGRRADPDTLLAYARERLAAYKLPRAIHVVDSLPTTSSGKIMRRELRVPTNAD